MELKARYEIPARGTIIETVLDRGKGPIAIAIVMEGTLKVGDLIVTSGMYGKVRALLNDKGERIKKATPSMPVQIVGLPRLPVAGENFTVVENERRAKELISQWGGNTATERSSLSGKYKAKNRQRRVKGFKSCTESRYPGFFRSYRKIPKRNKY